MSYNRLVNGVLQPIAGSVVTDSTLSATSTNAVQNSAVTTKINEIDSDIESLNNSLSDLAFGEQSGTKNIINASDITVSTGSLIIPYTECELAPGKYTLSFNASSAFDRAFQVTAYKVGSEAHLPAFSSNKSGRISTVLDITENLIAIALYCNGEQTCTYSNFMLEHGDQLSEYEPYIPSVKMLAEDVTKVNETLSDLEFGEYAGGKNLVDFSKVTRGKYIGSSDGFTINTSPNIGYTDFIKVEANTQYTLNATIDTRILYYSDKSTFVSTFKTTTKPQTFTVPSNCNYIRMNVELTDEGSIQLEKGSSATDYEPYIMSNKQLTKQNESLVDNGITPNLLKSLIQGERSSGSSLETISSSSVYLTSQNCFDVKEGDEIYFKVKSSKSTRLYICSNSSVSLISITSDVATCVVPSGVTKIAPVVGNSSGISPSDIQSVELYINNELVELKNDLVSQKAGNTITTNLVGFATPYDASKMFVTVTFPFLTNNTNYSITLKDIYIENIGQKPSPTVTSTRKQNGGATFVVSGFSSLATYRAYCVQYATVEITFA